MYVRSSDTESTVAVSTKILSIIWIFKVYIFKLENMVVDMFFSLTKYLLQLAQVTSPTVVSVISINSF